MAAGNANVNRVAIEVEWEQMLAHQLPVCPPFDEADAQAAAAIRAALKTSGQPIGAYDVLIAGTGLARGLVLVTSNIGEFRRLSGLQVEDWR